MQMRLFVFGLLLALVSCGAPPIKNDRAPYADVEARFQSVMTRIGSEYRIGNGVYLFEKGSEISHLDLEIYTAFEGTYHIKAVSCFVDWPGRYVDSEIVRIPVVNFLQDTSESKTCTVTIQISPTVKDSEVTIFPRYAVIVLTVSGRDFNFTDSEQLRKGVPFEPIRLDPEGSGNYQVVRKCTYEGNAKKIGPFSHTGLIELSSKDLSENLFEVDADGNQTPVPDFSNHLGNCYFSILYSDGRGITKIAKSINIFKNDHVPLQLSVQKDDKKYKVRGPNRLYICKIGDYSKLGKDKCDRKIKDLPKSFDIQGHTNKRSAYIVIGDE